MAVGVGLVEVRKVNFTLGMFMYEYSRGRERARLVHEYC